MRSRFASACTAALLATVACGGGTAAQDHEDASPDVHPTHDASMLGDDSTFPLDATTADDASETSDATLDASTQDAARDAASDGGAAHDSGTRDAAIDAATDGAAACMAETQTDNANCGTCEHACESGTVCTGGECKITCGALATCTPDGGATYCAKTDTDNANCGSCGHPCGAGTVCSGGACTTTCGAAFVTCGGSCVDGQNDPNHCGASGTCAGAAAGVQCDPGKSCVSGSCVCAGKSTCGGACVDTAVDAKNCGGCNNVCQGLCVNGGCVTSCANLLALEPSAPSGTYLLDPDGVGPQPAYSAYCDMTHNGGGWTLALKADGRSSTTNFPYASPLWTNASTLNDASANLSTTEAKYRSFSQIVATSVLLVVADTTANATTPPTAYQPIALSTPATLLGLVSGAFTPTALGRSAWTALGDGATVQPNCGKEGFNVYYPGPYARARIGILGNQEADCDSPDSALGFGLDVGPNNGCWTNDPSFSVGVIGGGGKCGGGADEGFFGYVFVR